ncbi:unnamed protein product [Amoebophrya sp. A25]|nr:unnamed protein product [Amoebophrya sp. A25]|eukprot:GSA25T00017631001.1
MQKLFPLKRGLKHSLATKNGISCAEKVLIGWSRSAHMEAFESRPGGQMMRSGSSVHMLESLTIATTVIGFRLSSKTAATMTIVHPKDGDSMIIISTRCMTLGTTLGTS